MSEESAGAVEYTNLDFVEYFLPCINNFTEL